MSAPMPELDIAGITVLLKVDGLDEPLEVGGFVVEGQYCRKAQIGAALIEIGSDMLDHAERVCGGSECGGDRS